MCLLLHINLSPIQPPQVLSEELKHLSNDGLMSLWEDLLPGRFIPAAYLQANGISPLLGSFSMPVQLKEVKFGTLHLVV